MSETATSSTTVVVGIDGSDASMAALRFALREADTLGADVDVVHCWHAGGLRDVAFGSSHELSNASACMLDNEIRAARKDTGFTGRVTPSSVHGQPAAVLVDRSRGAALLVLGAHGHSTLRDAAFGTVAASCRKHAGSDLVVVAEDGTTTRHLHTAITVS
ncbi:MAG: universal stress protein [Nakamurella sp.]